MFERINEEETKKSPEENLSVFHPYYWTFWWLNSLIFLGNKKNIEMSDIYERVSNEKTKLLFKKYINYFNQ
jgi:hypothetical protein